MEQLSGRFLLLEAHTKYRHFSARWCVCVFGNWDFAFVCMPRIFLRLLPISSLLFFVKCSSLFCVARVCVCVCASFIHEPDFNKLLNKISDKYVFVHTSENQQQYSDYCKVFIWKGSHHLSCLTCYVRSF